MKRAELRAIVEGVTGALCEHIASEVARLDSRINAVEDALEGRATADAEMSDAEIADAAAKIFHEALMKERPHEDQ